MENDYWKKQKLHANDVSECIENIQKNIKQSRRLANL